MTRIEIVTHLMAAAVANCTYGVGFVTERDIEACERLADGIIAYDEAHKEADK